MNMIDVSHLTFSYKLYSGEPEHTNEKKAIDDVSLSVRPGDFIGILGPNGSGKSTLARQLTGLLVPGGGFVYVKGLDTSIPENTFKIRKTAGIVFQNPDNQLIGSTVEEDVAFGMENLGIDREEMRERITTSLEATGMTACRLRPPGTLSGGQKQRAAIAGILAMEPECIVFDEPTAMLDPSGREEVMKAVRFLNRDKKITIIYITHLVDEVEDADYLYVMDQGKIALQGKPCELWDDPAGLTAHGCGLPFLRELTCMLKEKSSRLNHVLSGILPEGEQELIRILAAMAEKDDLQPEKEPAAKMPSSGGICLNDVSYSYRINAKSGHKEESGASNALEHISLSIGPGEFVAFVGPTGSGKSTLFQHLNGILSPLKGTVCFEGQDIHEKGYPLHSLRQKVALCFQYPEYQLFEETVLKDICFGPSNIGCDPETCLEKARHAMALTGLPGELEDHSPFSLSGGEKRRAALAGVLAMEPAYLLLDEPAAGLDRRGKEQLFMLLKSLNRDHNITVIMAAHDMNDVAALADRVIVMKEGQLMADGCPENILGDESLLDSVGLKEPDSVRFYKALCRQMDCPESGLPLTVKALAERICLMCGEEKQ